MVKGGTKGAMKFPMPSIWEYLLQYHYFTGNKEALKAVEITLNNMANGGIYDQVGGGFSRYATDSLTGMFLILKKCFMITRSL